jgi:hypothetical protein
MDVPAELHQNLKWSRHNLREARADRDKAYERCVRAKERQTAVQQAIVLLPLANRDLLGKVMAHAAKKVEVRQGEYDLANNVVCNAAESVEKLEAIVLNRCSGGSQQ